MSLANLRRYVNASLAYKNAISSSSSRNKYVEAFREHANVEARTRRLPRPLSRTNTQKLEQARRRMNNALTTWQTRANNERRNLERAKAVAAAAFGRHPNRFMTPEAAMRILGMGENAAARSIARAVNNSALVNRAAHKKFLRNSIKHELEFYINNGSFKFPLRRVNTPRRSPNRS